jgi:hypothetical protein
LRKGPKGPLFPEGRECPRCSAPSRPGWPAPTRAADHRSQGPLVSRERHLWRLLPRAPARQAIGAGPAAVPLGSVSSAARTSGRKLASCSLSSHPVARTLLALGLPDPDRAAAPYRAPPNILFAPELPAHPWILVAFPLRYAPSGSTSCARNNHAVAFAAGRLTPSQHAGKLT